MPRTWKYAKELEGDEYQLLLDSQDLEFLGEYYPFIPSQDITGALVIVGNGDYEEVWLCEDNRPYDNFAVYRPLEFYREEA